MWWLISIINSIRLELSWKCAWVCPWQCFQKGFTEEGEPILEVGGTNNAEVPGMKKKRVKKPVEHQHSSLLPNCECSVTSGLTLLPPCLPTLWAILSHYKPFFLLLLLSKSSCFILLIRKVTERKTWGHLSQRHLALPLAGCVNLTNVQKFPEPSFPSASTVYESRLSHVLIRDAVDKVPGMGPHRGQGSIHSWAGSRRKTSMGLVHQWCANEKSILSGPRMKEWS